MKKLFTSTLSISGNKNLVIYFPVKLVELLEMQDFKSKKILLLADDQKKTITIILKAEHLEKEINDAEIETLEKKLRGE